MNRKGEKMGNYASVRRQRLQCAPPRSATKAQKVLVLAGFYQPAFKAGGPVRSVSALIEGSSEEFAYYVVAWDSDWGESTPLNVPQGVWTKVGRAHVLYLPAASRLASLRCILRLCRGDWGYVYLNSIFDPLFGLAPLALCSIGGSGRSRWVVAPRGQLGGGALRLGARKKAITLRGLRAIGVAHKMVWHATAETEAEAIRECFPGARILVAPNETELPVRAKASELDPDDDCLRLVYVGRISEKKGVHLLLEALQMWRGGRRVSLEVVGSAADSAYLALCESLAGECPTTVDIAFTGPKTHADVLEKYKGADFFVLPTANENFGHVVAESLSCGCPVVVPDTTPWTRSVEEGGGLILQERTASCLLETLTQAAAAAPVDLAGRRRDAARAYDRWQADRASGQVFELLQACDDASKAGGQP